MKLDLWLIIDYKKFIELNRIIFIGCVCHFGLDKIEIGWSVISH